MIQNSLATSVVDSRVEHLWTRTVQPYGAIALAGIAFWNGRLIALDPINGYLLEIDPRSDDTKILNTRHWSDFQEASGLAIANNTLWFTRDDDVFRCSLDGKFEVERVCRLDDRADGIAVSGATVYVSSEYLGAIVVLNDQGREITRLSAPGIGRQELTVKGEQLWVCDRVEQTVFCIDRATGEIIFSMLTPFEEPAGIAFARDSEQERLYIAYSQRIPYIRDNPNADPNHELQYRDRAFIHPLHFSYFPDRRYTLSNGFLVEISYLEEIAPLDPVEPTNLEWRIALPAETERQKVHRVEPVGMPFSEEIQNGQRIAVFKFENFSSQDRFLFGWKALVEVWSIKYQFQPLDGENCPPLSEDLKGRYLVDDDDLAMGNPSVQQAAREAIAGETNPLRQMYNIRNYVYDKLAYGIRPQIDTPDVVLQRGVGSCGEYLGVLLALARLNGIACRTVGRYKCPSQSLEMGVPLQPDYNHVWMEFYLPGWGWLPMESNPDDINEGGPYPTRFFMGLAWYHAEMAKGVPFEKVTSDGIPLKEKGISIGDLAINHVRFTLLEELDPNQAS